MVWKHRLFPITLDNPPVPLDPQKKIDQMIAAVQFNLKRRVDALGRGIDPEIIEAVAASNLADFSTRASCQGHCGEEDGIAAPWIEIAAKNEPAKRFNQQEETFQKVAARHGCFPEEIKNGTREAAYWEALKEMAVKGETEEYVNWEEANQALLKKMEKYIQEFNEKYPATEELEIRSERLVGGFRIYSGGKNYEKMAADIPLKEQADFRKKLTLYQERMRKFTRFLLEENLKEREKPENI